jgi:integrase
LGAPLLVGIVEIVKQWKVREWLYVKHNASNASWRTRRGAMANKRRGHGDGALDQRGPDVWRLRYRVAGRRFAKTIRGTRREAQQELRRLLRTADTGAHVAPDKVTLGDWVATWVSMGAPGRKRQEVGKRSLARYRQLLNHAVAALGNRPLQQLRAGEIDAFYVGLQAKGLAKQTIHHVHTVLGACLHAATVGDGKILAVSPMHDLLKKPSPGEADHGIALDPEQTRKLVAGFSDHPLGLLVLTALHTGARRNELLGLQWRDFDPIGKTLRIERSLERVGGSSGMKSPKTLRSVRVISVEDHLIELLLSEKARHLRIEAGVSDGAKVDLGLIKLPEGALIFPGSPAEGFDFTIPRNPNTVTNTFHKVVKRLGFPKLRFHDLRGTAITRMLSAGIPPHIVAKRHGHDPAIMLRAYAKALPQDDAAAAKIMSAELKGV